MQIKNVTEKENQPKPIVFWSFLFFWPTTTKDTDTESENESVKSFPASTLFDQIKLCVLFDWNWIVVKGQAFKFIQWEEKISEVRVLLQYLILNQHSLI